MGERGLNARQKGDIYWKKLKRYIASGERHRENAKGDKDTILAREILALEKETPDIVYDEKNVDINGDEFKVMPPTATANEIFGEGIVRVIKYKKAFEKMLSDSSGSGMMKVLYNSLEELTLAMGNAIDAFFYGAGIDPVTGEPVAPEKRREAKTNRKQAFDKYEKTIKNFRRDASLIVVASLETGAAKEEGLDADTAFCNEEADRIFLQVKELDPGMYDFSLDDMDRLKDDCRDILRNEADLSRKLQRIETLVHERSKDASEKEVTALKDVIREYGIYIEEKSKRLAFEKNCCVIYARYILTDEMVDPLTADYIFEKYGERVKTYPLDEAVCSLPDYVNIEYDPFFEPAPIESKEGMEKVSEELSEYIRNHPAQFESPTITSLFFGTGDLPVMEKTARNLRNAIAGSLGSEFAKEIQLPENSELLRMWTEADAFVSVATQVLDYALLNRRKTIKELLDTFESDTYEMSFSRQKKMSGRALKNAAEREDA